MATQTANGKPRTVRARARDEQFLTSQRGTQVEDQFATVQRLYSEGVPATWKNKHAFLGPVRLMKKSGEMTKEGEFLETQGWVRPGRLGKRIPA